MLSASLSVPGSLLKIFDGRLLALLLLPGASSSVVSRSLAIFFVLLNSKGISDSNSASNENVAPIVDISE